MKRLALALPFLLAACGEVELTEEQETALDQLAADYNAGTGVFADLSVIADNYVSAGTTTGGTGDGETTGSGGGTTSEGGSTASDEDDGADTDGAADGDGACTAAGVTLSEAQANFRAQCGDPQYRDCDPTVTGFMCSSAQIGSSAPWLDGGGTGAEPDPVVDTGGGGGDPVVDPDPDPVYTGREPQPTWADSYSIGGLCYIDSTFDHGAGDLTLSTPVGVLTMRQIAAMVGPGPGKGSNPVYNDINCGNGPPNDVGDEDQDQCPGRVDMGRAGCYVRGPSLLEHEALQPPREENVQANLRTLPTQLDQFQRTNLHALTGGVTYTDPAGTVKQAWGYWDSRRRAVVTVRNFPDGQWSDPIDIHDAVTGRGLEYDAHNWLSLAVAPDGTLFAAGNMHVDPLQMARSTQPYDWTTMVTVPRSELNTADTDRVTYPDFFTLQGQLYFLYREQENAGGQAYFRNIIKRYVHTEARWETAAVLNRGRNLRQYVSKVTVSPDGQRAHLIGLWRDDSSTGPSASVPDNHMDMWHLFSDDGTTWQQYDSGPLSLPLWFDNGLGDAGQQIPELIWDTSAGDPKPQNTGSVTVDSEGNPHALLKERGSGANYHARRENGEWVVTRLPWSSSSQSIVALDSGVGALYSISDRVYFINLDGSDQQLLTDGLTNNSYWVRQDWSAQQRGYVSVLLADTLNNSTGRQGTNPQTGRIMTIPVDDLPTTNLN